MRPTASAKKNSSENGTSTERAKLVKRPKQAAQFAVCVDNKDYPASLELHKIYRILTDEAAAEDGDLRVIDESGEDYLYPARNFLLIEVPKAVERALLKAS